MIDRTALYQVMKRIESEKGPFVLFALFLPADSPGPWDLVLSAPWLGRGTLATLDVIAKALVAQFSEREMTEFSQIVALEEDSPSLQAILNDVGTVRQPFEKSGRNLFGLEIIEAYILKAQRPRLAT